MLRKSGLSAEAERAGLARPATPFNADNQEKKKTEPKKEKAYGVSQGIAPETPCFSCYILIFSVKEGSET